MQVDFRGWGEFALHVAETIAATVLAVWGLVQRTINRMGEAIRTEFATADAGLATLEAFNELDRRVTIMQADMRGLDQTYGEIKRRLEEFEHDHDEDARERQKASIDLEHRLTKLEGRLPNGERS